MEKREGKMEKVFDVHTHLNPVELGAKGLRKIIGYHFLVSEAVSLWFKSAPS